MNKPSFSKLSGAVLAMLLTLAFESPRAETAGVVDKNWVWTAADTKTGALRDGMIILRVCWDIDPFLDIPGGQGTLYWKGEVEKHIQEYWNGYAGIKFVFNETPCDLTVGHDDLRYYPGTTKDWRPNAVLGKGAVDLQNQNKDAVILCWTFKNYAPGYIGPTTYSTSTGLSTTTYDASYHRASILSQATHEFGHVLGLAHEQNNVDKPASCTEAVDNKDATPITLYDEYSIMNYCNPNYGHNQYTPSCGDIATIRAIYGLHPTEKKSMGCILECASGLGDNLAKTEASLSGCKLPTAQTIIGELAGQSPRVEYPGQGGTPSSPVALPNPQGTPSGIRAILNVNVTKTSDDLLTLNITTANGSEFSSHQVWVHHIDGYLPKEVMKCCYNGIDAGGDRTVWSQTQTVTWTPSTIQIPAADNGPAPLRSPSKLHFGWNSAKTKILFSNYSSLLLSFDYYTCPSATCLVHGQQRVKIMDIPQSIEFFNSMDANTVVPRPSHAYIPPKYTSGVLEIAPFYMDRNEVTQREYMYIMRQFPFNYPGDADMPAEGMTMYDAVLYCNKRSVLEGLAPVYSYTGSTFDADGNCTMLANLSADKSKSGYRLPTLSEWNYAYLANTTTSYFWGNTLSDGLNYSWSQENSGNSLHNVALKSPNPWGLYDMLGNVQEWTLDRNYGPDGSYIPDFQCVVRGWYSWDLSYQVSSSQYSTCGSAGSKWPFIGFRPIRNATIMAPILNLLLQ